MWYYCEKLNTLSEFDESEVIKDEYDWEDGYCGAIIGTIQDFYHISDLSKENTYKKVIISESDIELIFIGKKAQLFYKFIDDLNTCYIDYFSLSYVETQNEVEENFNTFFLNMDDDQDYYSKKKYYNNFCIWHNTDDMSYFTFTFLENIKIGDDRNTYLLK